METEEQKQLILDVMGEIYTDVYSAKTLLAFPGQTTSMIADYHNPYDAQNLDYTLTTTKAALELSGIIADTILQDRYGTHFRVSNLTPDPTGWFIIRVAWEDGHVFTTADN